MVRLGPQTLKLPTEAIWELSDNPYHTEFILGDSKFDLDIDFVKLRIISILKKTILTKFGRKSPVLTNFSH